MSDRDGQLPTTERVFNGFIKLLVLKESQNFLGL